MRVTKKSTVKTRSDRVAGTRIDSARTNVGSWQRREDRVSYVLLQPQKGAYLHDGGFCEDMRDPASAKKEGGGEGSVIATSEDISPRSLLEDEPQKHGIRQMMNPSRQQRHLRAIMDASQQEVLSRRAKARPLSLLPWLCPCQYPW
jgi:hypothetical protein